LSADTKGFAEILDAGDVHSVVAHNVMFEHPKLQWIPLGICGNTNNCWTSPMYSVRTGELPRERLLYVNFTITTNREHRTDVAAKLLRNGFAMHKIVSKDEFIDTMKTFAFCASPDGRAKDCYRTWEAISCACTPLVDDWPYVRSIAPWLPVVWVGAPPSDSYLHLPSWEAATPGALRALEPRARERMLSVGHGFLRRDIWTELLGADSLPSEPLVCAALAMSKARK